MAEINIETKIETADSAKGLKDLRKSLKDLVSAQAEVGAGTAEFKKLQNAINQTESKLGDLNDAFGTLKGSGVERLNGSLNLLREGFASADPDKLKIALQGIGAAMKAIPIFLVIEGLRLLYENFDKVIKLFGFGTSESDKLTEALKRQADAGNQVTSSYQRQISLSQAAGINANKILELERQKGEAELLNIVAQLNEIQKSVDRGHKLTDEEIKKQQELEAQYETTLTNTAATILKIDKVKEDAGKTAAENERKRLVDAYNRLADIENAEIDKEEAKKIREQKDFESAIAEGDARDKLLADQSGKNLSDRLQKEYDLEEKGVSERVRLDLKEFNDKQILADKELAEKRKREAVGFQIAQQGVGAIQALSNAVFAIKSNQYEKDSAEALAAAKKQFNINKGLQIATATISGVQAVLSVLAAPSVIPEPAGSIAKAVTAGLIGITAAANIATIAATKFEGGGSSTPTTSEGSASIPSIGGGSSVPESTPLPQSSFNPEAIQTNPRDNRVWVLESDITAIQKKVRVSQSRATFP